MKCSDLQDNISLYVDAQLAPSEKAEFERHLAECPLCRVRVDETREIRTGLRQFSRPAMPADMSARVRNAVHDEVRARRAAGYNPARFEWFQMRLMPLAVGVMTSLVIGFSFLSLMISGGLAIDDYGVQRNNADASIMLADGSNGANSNTISAVQYAHNRLAVAGESPSINPQGTLASLSRSIANHGIRNNEIVVVADVFSDGLASIAEVVEPSENVEAVRELRQALGSDLANAPFVPASLDNRQDSVRVVLKFQSVEVNSKKKWRGR